MRQVKRWILQIGICFTLLLSLGVYSMSNVHAVNEGITITDNTTGLSEAKYQVTFVVDSTKLGENVENIQLQGGFQFIKSSEAPWYQENGASNDGIRWYSAYEYEQGMYPTGGCGNTERTEFNYNGNYILYDMVKDENLYSVTLPLPATEYFYGYFVTYSDGSAVVVQDPVNPSKNNEINNHDATWSYFYVGNSSDALAGQSYIYPRNNNMGSYQYDTYIAYDGTENCLGIYLPNGYSLGNNYKTIYLAHGNGGNETEWCQLGSAGNIVDNLIAEGELADSIIVTLNNSHFSGTGFDIKSNVILAQDVVNNVIPFIEKNYKVSTDPKDRAYAGLSAGGVAASTVMEIAPDSFGYFGIISVAVQIDDEVFTDELISKLQTKKIYLSAGTVDFGLINSFFKASILDFMLPKLDAENIDYTFEIQNGGHDWNTWRGAFTTFAKDILWNQENIEYCITDGANKNIKQGEELKIKTDIPSSLFKMLIIDDQEIDRSKYTVSGDLITIILPKELISTLTIGEHILVIIANEGQAATMFNITADTNVLDIVENDQITKQSSHTVVLAPKTDDPSLFEVYCLFILLSGGAIVVIKKKYFN